MNNYFFIGPTLSACMQCSVSTGVNKLSSRTGPHIYLCDFCIEAAAESMPRIHKSMTSSLMMQMEGAKKSQERIQLLAIVEYEDALKATQELINSINSTITGGPRDRTETRLKKATEIGMGISKTLKLPSNRAIRQKKLNQQIKMLMIKHGEFNI